ncbi:MAG: hypothetical protein ABI353_16890 [Isosphaeraceae bacterium]
MSVFAASLVILLLGQAPAHARPFQIEVVDEETGRGVPLIELSTVNKVLYVTDSNGLVAFDEPGLMDQTVFFNVQGHGYEYPKDGFGMQGKGLEVREGGKATIKVKRLNIAERLYRITGAGIYRDTVLLGRKAPIREPVLNAKVFGSDSVVNAFYHGRLHWFWGDTSRPAYPLGNFHVPGAVSQLPSQGGLDPEIGIDLIYEVDKDGFAKPTAKMPGPGPTWISGPVVLRDHENKERMFAAYAKIKNLLTVYERGLAEWDDDARVFRKHTVFPEDALIYPDGHPFLHKDNGTEYVYFASPYPWSRVVADPEMLQDLSCYEMLTCLKEGSRVDRAEVDRDGDGRLRYTWKTNTSVVDYKGQKSLIFNDALKADEGLIQLRDAASGAQVVAHGASVYWNEHRKRWVMISVEAGGKASYLGEVWYAEADAPIGPWVYARKVVTHDKYSFYNPKQHPMLAKQDGRILFFEGTYTMTFSGNTNPTPRYDYNQIMYKLDLDDPRLNLPVAIYRASGPGVADQYGTVHRPLPAKASRSLAFFALDRPAEGAVPVFEQPTKDGASSLTLTAKAADKPATSPLFYALPADTKDAPSTTVPLFESTKDGRTVYETDAASVPAGTRPLCFVWRNPVNVTLP